eukprot:UC4_evm6s209
MALPPRLVHVISLSFFTFHLSTRTVTNGLRFSSVFSDNMVLQRATLANPGIRSTIFGDNAVPGETISAELVLNSKAATVERQNAQAYTDGSWKIFFAPHHAGGDYIIRVHASTSEPAMLENVTFGDIWFCSGQSNMELNLHFTFEKNDTFEAVANGDFENIRFFHMNHNPRPYHKPQYVINDSVPLHNWIMANNDAVINRGKGDQCPGRKCTWLDQFSAACFYFATSLTSFMRSKSEIVPIGLIESAYGGTQIEQWMSIEEQLLCKNISCHANSSIEMSIETAELCTKDAEMGNGGLFNGMVSPFVNMSIRGFLWYQGENNLFADAGNVKYSTGYACLLKHQQNEWQRIFSESGGTPSNAPFGIVSLADATDEGWGCNIRNYSLAKMERQMHWAETGNHGIVPNPDFPSAFIATAHDLAEPWDDGCKHPPSFCCTCANETQSPNCAVGPESPFNATTKFPWLITQGNYPCPNSVPSTPQLMGGVHPSTKAHVGKRLAQAAFGLYYGHKDIAWTGPIVAACGVEGEKLRVEFNKTLLGADSIIVAEYNRTDRASATFVRIDVPFPKDAASNFVYKNRAPYWGDDTTWIQVNIEASGESGFIADLSNLPNNSVVTGIKYGQGIPGTVPQNGHKRVCCGSRDVTLDPCPPENCPVSSAKGQLPAMPFIAKVLDGECEGLPPQVIRVIPMKNEGIKLTEKDN